MQGCYLLQERRLDKDHESLALSCRYQRERDGWKNCRDEMNKTWQIIRCENEVENELASRWLSVGKMVQLNWH